MVDFEKGSAAWDIGMMLTRHHSALLGGQPCSRVAELRRTANTGISGHERLALALLVPCDCGMGDSIAETTSIKS